MSSKLALLVIYLPSIITEFSPKLLIFYLQNLKNKAEKLSRGVTSLEDKCSDLSCTVDNLNSQLEKSLKNEDDLTNKAWSALKFDDLKKNAIFSIKVKKGIFRF